MKNWNFSMNDRDMKDESINFDFHSESSYEIKRKLNKFFRACDLDIFGNTSNFVDDLYEMKLFADIEYQQICDSGDDGDSITADELLELTVAFNKVIEYVESRL